MGTLPLVVKFVVLIRVVGWPGWSRWSRWPGWSGCHPDRMISPDEKHSENKWFSRSKPSNYRGKLRCHTRDGRTNRRKLENRAVFWWTRNYNKKISLCTCIKEVQYFSELGGTIWYWANPIHSGWVPAALILCSLSRPTRSWENLLQLPRRGHQAWGWCGGRGRGWRSIVFASPTLVASWTNTAHPREASQAGKSSDWIHSFSILKWQV